MNEERIAVGMQGMALASSAFLYARRYCEERLQGPSWRRRKDKVAPNVPIIEHPDIRRMLMWQKSHVEGMRALLLTTAYYADLSYSLKDDARRQLYGGFVELLTPICKAFCTDRGFESAIMGIQCLGGYGYTSEYDAEQYARDAKIGSIYEGTNYIQAQDFLSRKVPLAGGAVFSTFMKQMDKDLDEAGETPELAPYVALTREAKQVFEKSIQHVLELERTEEKAFHAFLHASDAVSMMGDGCLSHLLLKQANLARKVLDKAFESAGAKDEEARLKRIADDETLRFYYGKLRNALFYTTQVLPGVHAKSKAIFSDDASPMDLVL